jgi:Ca-activated chloride channel homolog
VGVISAPLGRRARMFLTAASIALAAFSLDPFPAHARAEGTSAQVPGSPGPAFRTGIELVSLNVTVIDTSGRYVTDLQSQDFSVFEDGAKQDVTFFSQTNLPIALALLLDTSASMESKMRTVQEAASGFASRLRPQDLAEVVDFDSRVTILQDFTNNTADLETAIRKTSPGGSTSLYNAVYVALKDLKKVVAKNADEIRRQAIVLLSDGEDTSSLLPFDEVLDVAKRSETAIYTIGLHASDAVGVGTKGFNEAEFVLRQLAEATGGRTFSPNQISDLTNVYGEISNELSSQYMVGYTSRNQRRDGGFRRIVVRVARPNAVARTKQGYFAPASH